VRTIGFILSVLGATAAGGLGLSWLRGTSCSDHSHGVSLASLTAFDPTIVGAYLLVVSLVLGCIAGTMILQGRGRLASAMLICAGLTPGLVEPKAFVVTFVLILAGLLAYGIRRNPVGEHPTLGAVPIRTTA
jgi:hypothetical protein